MSNKILVFALSSLLLLPACFQSDKVDEKPGVASAEKKVVAISGEQDKIREYYTKCGGEEKRLFTKPSGIIERLRTESILRRNLPPTPAIIYDIGGGAGVYAFELAKQGYTVHLIDYTPLHIEQAKKRMLETGIKLAECTVGDAKDVRAENAVADVVLLLGPLYHLLEKSNRIKALREAYRILKPNGILFAAGFNRIAALIKFGEDSDLQTETGMSVVEEVLKTGKLVAHKGMEIFTNSYYHKPEELEQELQEAGFEQIRLLGMRGPIWSFSLKDKIVADKKLLEKFLYFLEVTENDKSTASADTHIMAVGKKR